MRRITPGLFDTQAPRPDRAQPLVSIDGTGRPFYSVSFTALSEDDQALVRAQGEALAREWADSQAAQVVTHAKPIALPSTPTQELSDAIGEASAAFLTALAALDRMSGALRACAAEGRGQ